MSRTYLSIIVCGRNDNYGGDFMQRLQRFFDWNAVLLEKYKIPSEIIFVNWNPLTEYPPIEQQISFPKNRKYTHAKIIEVPHSIHKQYEQPHIRKTVPIFEFIAKNAGIRRATGDYILCVNADILIHPMIFDYIARNKLKQGFYYRANRLDFRTATPCSTVNEFFNAGFAISLKGFVYRLYPHISKPLQYRLLKLYNQCRILWELWKYKNRKQCERMGISVVYDNSVYYAHCMASGDFMLMHQKHWHELRAYNEHTLISTHTDALLVILAYTKLREYVFAEPIFHQEHERRYVVNERSNDETLINAFRKYETLAQSILAGTDPINFMNDENWGLKQFVLNEKII
jgi:hypothetical protein